MLGIVCLLSNGHTPKYTSFRATPTTLGPCCHAPGPRTSSQSNFTLGLASLASCPGGFNVGVLYQVGSGRFSVPD